MTTPVIKHYHQSTHDQESQGSSRHFGRTRRPQGRLRPFSRDERRGRRTDIYIVTDRKTGKGVKGCYYEYHKKKYSWYCQLLSAKVRNGRETTKREPNRDSAKPPHQIWCRVCKGWYESEWPALGNPDHMRKKKKAGERRRSISHHKSIQGFTFSATDPRLVRWWGDNLLIVQGSIRNTIIHRVYVDTDSFTRIFFAITNNTLVMTSVCSKLSNDVQLITK